VKFRLLENFRRNHRYFFFHRFKNEIRVTSTEFRYERIEQCYLLVIDNKTKKCVYSKNIFIALAYSANKKFFHSVETGTSEISI
jgi:hypothetical protein